MTDHRFSSRDRLDDHVVDGLRAVLAPPGGDGYWSELEHSIMSRLESADLGWWGELTAWARPALVAAAVLIFTATAAMMHRYQVDAAAPYENVVSSEGPPPLPDELSIRPVALGDREQTLRFLFAH